MKKIIGVFVVVAVIVGIFYLTKKEKPQEEISDNDTNTTGAKDQKFRFKEKATKKEFSPIKIPKKTGDKFTDYKNELEATVEQNRRSVEECEREFDEVFGDTFTKDEEVENLIKDEARIAELIEGFNRIELKSKTSSKLLEMFSSNMAEKLDTGWLGTHLQDLRPCKPLIKASFVETLMFGFSEAKWSNDTKKKARDTVFDYFDKELKGKTSLEMINMHATFLESMAANEFVHGKYEDEIINLKDDIEDARDEILEKVIDKRSKQDLESPKLPIEIMKKESVAGEKFQKKMVALLKRLRK